MQSGPHGLVFLCSVVEHWKIQLALETDKNKIIGAVCSIHHQMWVGLILFWMKFHLENWNWITSTNSCVMINLINTEFCLPGLAFEWIWELLMHNGFSGLPYHNWNVFLISDNNDKVKLTISLIGVGLTAQQPRIQLHLRLSFNHGNLITSLGCPFDNRTGTLYPWSYRHSEQTLYKNFFTPLLENILPYKSHCIQECSYVVELHNDFKASWILHLSNSSNSTKSAERRLGTNKVDAFGSSLKFSP